LVAPFVYDEDDDPWVARAAQLVLAALETREHACQLGEDREERVLALR
jgi:hypothetical protein